VTVHGEGDWCCVVIMVVRGVEMAARMRDEII